MVAGPFQRRPRLSRESLSDRDKKPAPSRTRCRLPCYGSFDRPSRRGEGHGPTNPGQLSQDAGSVARPCDGARHACSPRSRRDRGPRQTSSDAFGHAGADSPEDLVRGYAMDLRHFFEGKLRKEETASAYLATLLEYDAKFRAAFLRGVLPDDAIE